MCIGHAKLARSLIGELRSSTLIEVLPRARRLMLEARANLEQWRVAVSRNKDLEEQEREIIQSVMSMARRDVESSYSMVAKEVNGRAGMETVEYALRRTARAMVAMLIELVKIAPTGDAVEDMQREDLMVALRTRAAYGQLAIDLSGMDGPVADRLHTAGRRIRELISGESKNDIRIADVTVFQGLLERIDEWGSGPSATPGEALWSEVESVGSLLRGINQREILRNHDKRVLGELHDALESDEAVLTHWGQIDELLGMDASLDEMLAAPSYERGPGLLASVRNRIHYLATALGL